MSRMKNSIKQMMALCLAVIMTLALALTGFATELAETKTETKKGSLRVELNENNTWKGQTIFLYKLFDVTVDTPNVTDERKYAYTVNEKYVQTLRTVLNMEDDKNDFYEKLKDYTDKGEEIQKFANDFTAALLNSNPKIEADATSGKIETDENAYRFEDLDLGYYLVYQTGTQNIQSSLITVYSSNIVNLKGTSPSIEKEADKTSIEIGDVVTYTIKGTIPDTTGYESYVYKIHDTLTDGLDFVEDLDATAPTDKKYDVKIQIGTEQATTLEADLDGDNNRKMILDLSSWVQEHQQNKGEEFTVTYYAKVNQNAVVETKNSAHLEYGNDPDHTTDTVPDQVVTTTYPLKIRKTDEHYNDLPGAVFRLYRSEDDANQENDNAISFSYVDSSETYVVDANGSTKDLKTISEYHSDNTAFGAIWNLKLNGLKEGTYWLVETKAPDGYNKLKSSMKVEIVKDKDNELQWDVFVDGKKTSNEREHIINVINKFGTILPGTGGMGTAVFTVVAVVMMLGVAISFVKSRNTEE